MGQPVKLSDALILDARIAGEVQERSIAGQVEFWAKLGQATEQMLDGRRIRALRSKTPFEALSDAIAMVDTRKGRARLNRYLEQLPYPHYEQHPDRPELLVRTEENGKRTVGRFVNRQFIETAEPGHKVTGPRVLENAVRQTRRARKG